MSGKIKGISKEKAKDYYEYGQAFSNWKSTREIMVSEIIASAIKMYQELSTELVKNDPKLSAVWDEVREVIRKNYPNYVHDATVHFFASKMNDLSTGIQQAMFSNMDVNRSLNEVKSRLGLPQ